MAPASQIITESVRDLFVYFGKRPQPAVIDMYVEALNRFTQEQAIMTCKHFITNADRLPKIVDMITYVKNTWDETTYKEYDRDYDPDFPMEHLWSAYYLLVNNKGNMRVFHDFCEKHRMPRQDRDGVIGKYCRTHKINKQQLLAGWHDKYKG